MSNNRRQSHIARNQQERHGQVSNNLLKNENVNCPVVVIEEEPAHEFYASLFGKTTKTTKTTTPSFLSSSSSSSSSLLSLTSSSCNAQSLSQSIITIPPDDDNNNNNKQIKNPYCIKGNSEFAKMYNQALSSPPPPPPVHSSSSSSIKIHKTNKGFQLLQQMGWNEKDGGLGKNRQGILKPCKVIFKNDKLGLGRQPAKKRNVDCTTTPHHHQQQQHQQQQQYVSKAKRRQLKKQEKHQEEQREKRVKMMLRTDVPLEYEDLYFKLYS